MLLTGQDIGFEIGQSEFYKNWLGLEFIQDHAGTNQVLFSDQELDLTEGDNIHYPRSLDVMKILTQSVEVFCTYKNDSIAGIHLQRGNGNLIYLGFGFEAIAGETARARFLQHILKTLQTSMEKRLERIRWAYQNDPLLLRLLIERFERLPFQERQAARNWIMQQQDKAPFKALLASDLYSEN